MCITPAPRRRNKRDKCNRNHVENPINSSAPFSPADFIKSTAMHNLSAAEKTLKQLWRKYQPQYNKTDVKRHKKDYPDLFSRLFYTHAASVAEKLDSKTHLQCSDGFSMPMEEKMDKTIPELQQIYDKCRSKARGTQEIPKFIEGRVLNYGPIEYFKKHANAHIAKSQSLVLTKAIVLHQRKKLVLTGCLRLLHTILEFFKAHLVGRLLRLLESGESLNLILPVQASFYLVAILLLKMVVDNKYCYWIGKSAMQVRGALSGLIFDKALRMNGGRCSSSVHSKEVDGENGTELGAGGVINLMESDASIIESAILQVHTFWDGILQITVYTTLLYKLLGSSALCGFGVLLLQIPLNSAGLRVLNRLSQKQNEAKDARIRKTTEVILNMKLLKLQAWDIVFKDKIRELREEELRRNTNRGIFWALNSAIPNTIPSFILVVTLAAYKRSGGPIVASSIFAAISLFNQLRSPLYFYPVFIEAMVNGKQSLKRLSSYLCQEELPQYVQKHPFNAEKGGYIKMRNGNFMWPCAKNEVSPAAPALCGAELNVNPGEIIAVVGPVGSGKTALVKALLGELKPAPRRIVDGALESSSDSVTYNQSNDVLRTIRLPIVSMSEGVAYCAQESWLSKGTIRDAIIFGQDFNEKRYLSAIHDAGLDDDIVGNKPQKGLLTHDTEVGEGGSSLSGGQKARVQLARALYHQAGVYILDDPLSALDASIGATVFERMMSSLRRRKAAVIFVTNDPSLLKRCDRVVLMGKVKSTSGSTPCSQIVDVGTMDELFLRGHNLQTTSIYDTTPAPIETEVSISHTDLDKHFKINDKFNSMLERSASASSKRSTHSQNMTLLSNLDADQSDGDANARSKNFKNEMKTLDGTMITRTVPLSIYTEYLKSIRKPQLVALAFGCVLMVNGVQFFQHFVVVKWTEESADMSTALDGQYLRTITYAAVTTYVFLFLRGYIIMRAGIRASEYIHNRMLSAVFNIPVSFFDTRPSGQILARFGKEMETIDRLVPNSVVSVLYCFLQILMTMIGLAGVMTSKTLPVVVLIGYFYISTMLRFRPVSRDLKRCESKSRSSIHTHVLEAIRGAETIRSFDSTSTWSAQNRQLTDDNLSVVYTSKIIDIWLSIRLESLGNLLVLSASLTSAILAREGKLTSGEASWGFTQTLSITSLLAWAARVLADLENQMMSLMRITELVNTELTNPEASNSESFSQLRTMTQESTSEVPDPGHYFSSSSLEDSSAMASVPNFDNELIKSGWPWKGGISFRNVSMRYNTESPLVLRNVTVPVPPGSTLGIIGRTGSGKSSLLLTLFRISEIEKGGTIEIDGVDIRSISLQALRRSLSIIPQDPVLFSGTLMYNLDATGEATIDDAWEALDATSPELARQIRASGFGLNYAITEGGKNLSSGQRQLICLARALLRKSKILVLDEATSSVDTTTDAQVQETIRREFVNKGVSVITVAHRLDSVLGYDKIAVLGAGEIIEYGKPSELLKVPDGHLRQLVDTNKRKNKSNLAKSRTTEALFTNDLV